MTLPKVSSNSSLRCAPATPQRPSTSPGYQHYTYNVSHHRETRRADGLILPVLSTCGKIQLHSTSGIVASARGIYYDTEPRRSSQTYHARDSYQSKDPAIYQDAIHPKQRSPECIDCVRYLDLKSTQVDPQPSRQRKAYAVS